MKEIKGNLWDYYGKPYTTVLITTNGFVKNNGEAVMGRGCALEAAKRFPNFPAKLGKYIQEHGNIIFQYTPGLWTFPVKHNWYEKADLKLIEVSAMMLKGSSSYYDLDFILPRPGCGNGKLTWEEVKPVIEFLPDNVHVIDFA